MNNSGSKREKEVQKITDGSVLDTYVHHFEWPLDIVLIDLIVYNTKVSIYRIVSECKYDNQIYQPVNR
jgi:hypothetical protein